MNDRMRSSVVMVNDEQCGDGEMSEEQCGDGE